MGFLDDKVIIKRMERAKKEFELLKKPTQHFTKLDLVNSFRKKETN